MIRNLSTKGSSIMTVAAGAKAVGVLFVLLMLLGCGDPIFEEKFRTANESGGFVAVVGTLQTNATIATTTEVRIKERGAVSSNEAIVARFYKDSDLMVRWIKNDELLIKTKGATHFLDAKEFVINNRTIKILIENEPR